MHEQHRQEKQARERQSEAEFARPGKPSVRPFWCLVIGIALTAAALTPWMMVGSWSKRKRPAGRRGSPLRRVPLPAEEGNRAGGREPPAHSPAK